MAKIDADGLEDFEDEEREQGTADDIVDFDFGDDPDGGYDGDDIDFKSILKGDDELDEEDYEDEDEDKPDEEVNSEEDESTSAQDESFKNEENARNAERRRLEEAQRLEQIRQASPEFQMVQRLSQLSGKSPEQMMAELEEANIQRQAVQAGVPLELYRRTYQAEQTAQQANQRLQQLEFDAWNSRVDQESARLQTEFPMLDENDLFQAKTYILQTLQNTDVSLEQAVHALHYKKISEGLQDQARTEALADISGRKKSSGVPLSTKPASQPEGLSDEERAMARRLGMSYKDYVKYK
jgi:hypothetical protein